MSNKTQDRLFNKRRTEPGPAAHQLTPNEKKLPWRLVGDERRGWILVNDVTGERADSGHNWERLVAKLRSANQQATKS